MIHRSQHSSDDAYIHQITELLHQKNDSELFIQLNRFSTYNDKTKARILFEISVSENNVAFLSLNHLIEIIPSESPFKPFILDILLDKSRSQSKFIIPYIEHAALNGLKVAVPALAGILLNEIDSYILQKVIFAIGETKDKSCINVVADFIFYDHEELKREAIRALGKIGGSSSIERLEFASRTSKSDPFLHQTLETLKEQQQKHESTEDKNIKQFASRQDTLENLTHHSHLGKLIPMLSSESPHDRHQAIDSLITMGPKAIPAVSGQIDYNDPDSIINGLDILGNIGHEAIIPSILHVLSLKHPHSNVRFAAYEAISKLQKAHTSMSLFGGITDPSEQVRLAAATAINANLSDIMIAGLKSKIETSGRKSQKNLIASAIIDSHSGLIFSNLMDSDAFVFHVTEYLPQTHPSTAAYFTDILIQRGRKALAQSILSQVPPPKMPSTALTVFCVDDSTICLKYYTKLLHSMGHNPVTFSHPNDVLDMLKSNPPDMLISDLNMLSMNGLQLADKIRKDHPESQFPIFIITTQLDFVSTFQDMQNDSINHAIHKPLTAKDLKPLIDRFFTNSHS